MHRLLLAWTSLGLLGAALGCHHTMGVCDCDFSWGCPCYRSLQGPGELRHGGVIVGNVTATPSVAVTAAQELPKTVVKDMMPTADEMVPVSH